MEYENGFPRLVAAYRRPRFSQAGSEKKFFYGRGGVDIHGTRYMAPIILIIKSAIDDMKISDMVIKFAIKERVQLQQNISRPLSDGKKNAIPCWS